MQSTKCIKCTENRILNQLVGVPIRLSGDGCCDYPGHNAKYCTYSIMDQSPARILHFHVTNVAETDGNSNLMEKHGLIKVLEKLSTSNVLIESRDN